MELVLPSENYRDSFLAGERELVAAGDYDEDEAETAASFVAALDRWAKAHAGIVDPPWVPQTELWWVDGDAYIGRVGLRHRLSERLMQFGGHIGYTVRPSRRRQGHATQMLAHTLPRAHALGIQRALVTCDEANHASRRTIEKNGGILEDIIEYEGTRRMRFWIPTRPDFRPVV